MALMLNLGCVDIPYTTPGAKNPTTGDVAGWLENKYHVMQHFYLENEEKIAEVMADSVAGAVENTLLGAPAEGVDPWAAATSFIESGFRDFLARDVMATLGYPGVPTKAALEGVNPRLKQKKGASRPSFLASGTYSASFRSWVV